ncbi:S-adenosyl-L-methionine-dependent methyltransferase [Lasiosphaeria ovina]|uniref:S-adenosyl-L-methionine-dependent methyltransferase n=1 Tax=Lasiosphaeria ovina TaxID=92902 RepID=A0AAE0JSR5_9PEZI|nr:S-adenosyl-L-methionine-dependent methyltransferase [Lasiosphaeria ovina]
MSNPSLTRIAQLAATITAEVAKIDGILAARGLPSPSLDEDAPPTLPDEAADAQDAVIDAAAELNDLLREPLSAIYEHGGHNNNVCLQTIARFHISAMVPAGGRVSYADLAARTALPEQVLRRLLRHAMTMHVFREPEPGMVAHTRASKALTDPAMNAWLRIGTEEMWPAAVRMLDALQKWPESSEPNETGFSLGHNTSESIYGVIGGGGPELAVRFATAMAVYASRPEYSPAFIVDHYDWAALGPETRVVDVGGAQGHVAMALARGHANLASVLVQDMAVVVAGADAGVPAALKSRIAFMPHDLLAPQTVVADVYYFRWILHNWSDKHCVLILRAQIPVLKPGARIIIQETCMPEPGAVPRWKEKALRMNDINMGAVFNARERTVGEWRDLLAEADPRFVLKAVTEPKGSALGILEVVWNGTD